MKEQPRTTLAALRAKSDDWLVRLSPLHGLNELEAQAIYDAARQGNFSRLHWLYHNLEQTDPTLLVCVERRTGALVGLDWRVVARPTATDEALAEEQRAATEEALAKIDNLPDAIANLGLAFFRGFSHVAPDWDADGLCRHIDLPHSWNFCRTPSTGVWYWNPTAQYGLPGVDPNLVRIPDGETICVEHPRPIVYPATSIFLRSALAEMSWGQFLERFGIPPAFVTMPDGSTEQDVTRFRQAAEAFTNGQAGVLPYGSAIHFGTEGRGQNPFAEFVRHQSEMVVLLATGGTLTSLAQSGTGTLAGEAQMDVWREIVRRDAEIIGGALDKGLCEPLVRHLFPGKPVLVRFELGREAALSPAEVLDLAAKAKSAGYIIAQEELADAVGYTLERDASGLAAPGFFNATAGGVHGPHGREVARADLAAGKGDAGTDTPTPTPAPAPLENADGKDGGDIGALDPPANKPAREAFAEDMQEAARLVAAVIAAPDEELAAAAKAAVDKLPDALPEKPKFAAELEEAIAYGYRDGLTETIDEEKEAAK